MSTKYNLVRFVDSQSKKRQNYENMESFETQSQRKINNDTTKLKS